MTEIFKESSLDHLIRDWHQKTGAVGAAVCAVTKNGVVWSSGFGFADLDTQSPMNPERSILNIASVSKLVTATAVMQLMERGHLDLDVDIQRYVGFEIRHPDDPEKTITARHLLTHTSAIADGTMLWNSYAPDDPKIELGAWLKQYFDPKEVNIRENWCRFSPGQQHGYSNVGFGLLGLIVENISGLNFRRYTKEQIFDPLGMTSSGWFLTDIDRTRSATPYTKKGEDPEGLIAADRACTDQWCPLQPYGFPNYPDGLMRTTVMDLGRFASAMIEGHTVLKPETLTAMRQPVCRSYEGLLQGLGWFQESSTNAFAWGHNGCDPGVRTQLAVDTDLKCGFIFLTNTTQDPPDVDLLLLASKEFLKLK